MLDKAIRYDTIIAVSALLISALTSAAVVYQTHVISAQFSATVWPYLSFAVTRDTSHLVVELRNDGIGPALIRSVGITLDGKRVPSLNTIVDPIVAEATRSHKDHETRSTVSSLETGTVVPANEHVTLVQVEGAQATQLLLAAASRVNMSICYCSLLGRCWTKQFDDRTGQPHDTASCREAE
ncbi:MAG TPA: hypothetical protein VKF82_02875 [Candidatus Eremiobacteraceae bacterium]|nr:hypothetical protein [Candidatus Eremiobacteraceae bacterium]